MIYFLVPGQHEDLIDDYVRRMGAWAEEKVATIPFREAVEAKQFLPGRYVFAGLDRLGPNASQLLGDLHTQLHVGLGLPPLNHPTRSLRRYELLTALYDAGLNEFRAFGAWEDLSDLRFPAFVRHRSKDGGVPKLLSSHWQVETELGRALMGGGTIEELLVVEFLDTADSDGFYRKYAAYMVDGRAVPAGMAFGRNWVQRGLTQKPTQASVAEEREYVLGNPHESEISEIFRLANIEFGRIDYSLYEGRVQTWEINTLPMMRRPPGGTPLPEEIQRLRQFKKELSAQRLLAAWKEADSKQEDLGPVQVLFGSEVLERGQGELAKPIPHTYPKGDRFSLVRALLRPLKPLLKPLAEWFFFPLLARRARGGRKS